MEMKQVKLSRFQNNTPLSPFRKPFHALREARSPLREAFCGRREALLPLREAIIRDSSSSQMSQMQRSGHL